MLQLHCPKDSFINVVNDDTHTVILKAVSVCFTRRLYRYFLSMDKVILSTDKVVLPMDKVILSMDKI